MKLIFPDISLIYDKQTGGCSRRRPDIYIDLGTHVIIIEIDEDQHKDYDTTCETQRLNELYEDFACRTMIVIRFNPDGYRDDFGVDIKSCFAVDKRTGIQLIAPRKKTEWKLRLERLRDTIDKYTKVVPDNNEFINLYYDAI